MKIPNENQTLLVNKQIIDSESKRLTKPTDKLINQIPPLNRLIDGETKHSAEQNFQPDMLIRY